MPIRIMKRISFKAHCQSLALERVIVLFLCFMVLLISYFRMGNDLFHDEIYHYSEIQRIMSGDIPQGKIAMLRGYHYTIAWLGLLFDIESLSAFRILNSGISFCFIALVLFFYRNDYEKSSSSKALQLVSIPFFGILTPLIYVDIYSSFLVLLATFFAFNKKFIISGLIISLAIIVKQTNIVWLAFVWAISQVGETYHKESFKELTTKFFLNSWSFLIGALGFSLFLLINNGIAVGDHKNTHTLSKTSLVNIYVALFYFLIYMLPWHTINIASNKDFLYKEKYKIIFVFFIISIGYMFFSAPKHVFNLQYNVADSPLKFIYGEDLDTPEWRVIFLLVIPFISLYIEFKKNIYQRLVIIFSLIYLTLMPAVMARYYIPVFALWIVFRQSEGAYIGNITALWLLFGFLTHNFFWLLDY